jgi:hypothetical protein
VARIEIRRMKIRKINVLKGSAKKPKGNEICLKKKCQRISRIGRQLAE